MKINTFRIKTFITILACLEIPILLYSLLIFEKNKTSLIQQNTLSVQTSLSSSASVVETKLRTLLNTSQSLKSTLEDEYASEHPENMSDPHSYYISLLNELKVSADTLHNTYSIPQFSNYYLFFPSTNTLLVSELTYFEDLDPELLTFLKNPAYSYELSTPYNYIFYNIVGNHITSKNLSVNMPVNIGDEYCTLTACMPEDSIYELLPNSINAHHSNSFIIKSNGDIICSSHNTDSSNLHEQIYQNWKSVQTNAFELTIKDITYFVNIYQSPETNWVYISAIDAADVLSPLNAFATSFVEILLFIFLASLVITVLLTFYISKPLHTLQNAMRFVEERNFEIQISETRKDEFQDIYHGFNSMVTEINNLINNLTTEKILRRDAKIMLLQSQINPHLLYNTLESIYSMARIHQVDDIATLVMALSKFFRISLSGGKQNVSLMQAVDLAQQYLIIQSIRFPHLIETTFDIPEEFNQVRAPKFLLQPVIENSIKHGFENKLTDCKINVTATAVNGILSLVITDNGCGIPKEKLIEVRKKIENFNFENDSYNSYALRNINYQIKLGYGEQYGLRIYSQPNFYTKIVITLPIDFNN